MREIFEIEASIEGEKESLEECIEGRGEMIEKGVSQKWVDLFQQMVDYTEKRLAKFERELELAKVVAEFNFDHYGKGFKVLDVYKTDRIYLKVRTPSDGDRIVTKDEGITDHYGWSWIAKR